MLVSDEPWVVNVRFSQSQCVLDVLHCISVGNYDIPVTAVKDNLASVSFSGKKVSISVN